MRVNMPVTNVERHLKDGEYIVSKTDTKGQITYVNSTFMEISGLSAEDLMGAHHNIVRHPDMPPAAFGDLWKTLKSGKPWRGIVKNRCRNGDYYWIEANANPIYEGGRITGYMSLRTKQTRAQEITAASEEQSSGAAQINTTMSQMSQFTQQNASASEELAATSEEVHNQAYLLQQLMGFFKGGNLSASRAG